MTRILATVLFSTLTTSFAFGAPAKICFGSGDSKGSRFILAADSTQAAVSQTVGDAMSDDGSPFKVSGQVAGQDGQTYIDYTIPGGEGANDLLVDSALLNAGTQGLVKLRWRGESFGQSTFFCRDNQ